MSRVSPLLTLALGALDRGYRLDDGLAALAQAQLILTGPPWRDVMSDPNLNTMNRTNAELVASLLLFMIGQPPVKPQFDLEEAYRITAGDQSVPFGEIPRARPI